MARSTLQRDRRWGGRC